jgi:3-hydroxypropanoate dehydrogenase
MEQQAMSVRQPIAPAALAQLFTDARSHHHWANRKVSDETLKALYELIKWGPTSGNLQPARLIFVRSEAGRRKLYPALEGMGSNKEQVAQDTKFFEKAPRLFPRMDVRPMFEADTAFAESIAYRSSSLTGAYLILAARGLGLDVCPMSGFHNAILDEAFFHGTTWKPNFICTLGYGDDARLYPRDPRLTFEEACRLA